MSYVSSGTALCAAFIAAQAYRDGNGLPDAPAPRQGDPATHRAGPADEAITRSERSAGGRSKT